MISRILRISVCFFLVLLCLSNAVQIAQKTAAEMRDMDGLAALPRVYVQSGTADTPANGKIWQVRTAEELQPALDRVQCGDVVELQAGATFSGEFRLLPKHCDDQHWIVLRTSASDAQLPPEGTRLTPCYAGVSNLPGRPPLQCVSTQIVTAKIVGNPALDSRGAAVDHYRFVGLELSQPAKTRAATLLGLGTNSNHIIVDRCWLHGNSLEDTQRAVALNGSQLAVVDSTITDIHMVSTDTQGIAGWTGTGPLKIVDNFIEGGSSSIGLGGAGSQVTPRDIEIRRNHLFKPLSWRLGDPNFIGVRFNSKVLLESKNSSRVLIEGNIFENAWGGPQGGDGDAIWLGPKNQNNACPSCEVNDVTFRYNIIRHAGGALYVFDAPSDAGGIAQPAARYSIHDNLFEDIRTEYAGPGSSKGILFRFLGGGRFPPPKDISIQHNTGFSNGGLLQLLTTTESPLQGFAFKDNLVSSGDPALSGCRGRFGADALEACAEGPVFENNVVIGGGDLPKSNARFRKGHDDKKKINLYPKHWRDVFFVSATDYRLCKSQGTPPGCVEASSYAEAGSDGKDLGADIAKVYELTKGVE